MDRDIFICHASEDKAEVVRPLVKALEEENISCWLDEGEIKWGDSITQKVNEGLKVSRFLIVVFSQSFIVKKWPQRELFAALNQEASSGEVKILPLLIGDKSARGIIIGELPLLNDKKYLIWEGKPEPVVDAILNILSRPRKVIQPDTTSMHIHNFGDNIPLPKIRKSFTQRDRDLLLEETFKAIKEYFQHALLKLKTQYPEVETDFTEIHSTKFITKIYYRGDIKSQCKIWIGGLFGSDAIAYSENRFNIDSDNSYNEMVSIEDDGFDLKLRFSLNIMNLQQNKTYLKPSEAAEMLWLRFSAPLERTR